MDSIYFYQINIMCMVGLAAMAAVWICRSGVGSAMERFLAADIILIFSFHFTAMVCVEMVYGILRIIFLAGQLGISLWLVLSDRIEKKKILVYVLIPLAAFFAESVVRGAVFLPAAFTFSMLVLLAWMQQDRISTDSLTGLNNRREYVRYMNDSLERAGEEDEIFVAVVDIDGFKQVNDTYGHIRGDECLKRIAEVLKCACERRPGGLFLARYGGDEFVIAGAERECDEGEKLEAVIEQCMVEFYPESLVTLSMGWASMKAGRMERYDILFDMADQAMYCKKRKKLLLAANDRQR